MTGAADVCYRATPRTICPKGKGARPMADESYTLRSINWRELFPFTNLFRAFRVAVHPSKLVIALLGLLLIYSGGRVMDGIWHEKHRSHIGEVEGFWTGVPKSFFADAPAVGTF